jgi:hypothetical protein
MIDRAGNLDLSDWEMFSCLKIDDSSESEVVDDWQWPDLKQSQFLLQTGSPSQPIEPKLPAPTEGRLVQQRRQQQEQQEQQQQQEPEEKQEKGNQEQVNAIQIWQKLNQHCRNQIAKGNGLESKAKNPDPFDNYAFDDVSMAFKRILELGYHRLRKDDLMLLSTELEHITKHRTTTRNRWAKRRVPNAYAWLDWNWSVISPIFDDTLARISASMMDLVQP